MESAPRRVAMAAANASTKTTSGKRWLIRYLIISRICVTQPAATTALRKINSPYPTHTRALTPMVDNFYSAPLGAPSFRLSSFSRTTSKNQLPALTSWPSWPNPTETGFCAELMRSADFTDPRFTRNTSSRACRLASVASPGHRRRSIRREEAPPRIRSFYGKKTHAFRLSVDRHRSRCSRLVSGFKEVERVPSISAPDAFLTMLAIHPDEHGRRL